MSFAYKIRSDMLAGKGLIDKERLAQSKEQAMAAAADIWDRYDRAEREDALNPHYRAFERHLADASRGDSERAEKIAACAREAYDGFINTFATNHALIDEAATRAPKKEQWKTGPMCGLMSRLHSLDVLEELLHMGMGADNARAILGSAIRRASKASMELWGQKMAVSAEGCLAKTGLTGDELLGNIAQDRKEWTGTLSEKAENLQSVMAEKAARAARG